MAQVMRLPEMAAGADAADGDARRFLPPPGIHPNNAVFGAVQLPKPLTWQRREHMIQRRNILGRIGQLLKRNAQLVAGSGAAAAVGSAEPNAEAHAKTWALARKLEVLIFLNSASLMEYSNVDSLARRVQALTASIVNKKIRRQNGSSPSSVSTSASANVSASVSVSVNVSSSEQSTTPLPSAAALTYRRPRGAALCLSTAAALGPSIPVAGFVTPLVAAGAIAVPPQPLQQQQPPMLIPPDAQCSPVAGTARGRALPSIGFLIHHKRSADEMLQQQPPHASTSTMTMSPGAAVLECKPAKRARRPVDLGIFLFRGYEELNRIVWSYVDGTQIMRCRGVSRTARELAPLFVTSLQLSCNAVQLALATRYRGSVGGSSASFSSSLRHGACILRECVHLRHLEIVALSAGMAFGKLSMRALDCPQRFVVTHDDHEQIVLALAHQLRLDTFPQLTRLGLTCLFTNEEADGEADVLLNTLITGCCPQLEELCLPGNSFGDYGAAKIAQMLRARVCPKLTRLDLRRNFVGEDGVRSVCHALADGCAPQLVELCFGGNTVTDSSFHHILYALESGQLHHLRFLGIEMNYLSVASMEMLGRSIGKLVCPALSQISYSDNSVDNAVAKRAIATAVYQERVRRERRLQQIRAGEGDDRDHDDSHASNSDDDDDEDDDEAYSSGGE